MKLHTRCAVTLAALAAACAAVPAAHAVTLPSGFQQRTELSGLTRPTKIAWAPDGRRFVAEKDGRVRVAGPTGTSTTVLLDLRSVVNDVADRGLLGLAVDSDFANQPYIYLLYTYDVRKDTNPDTGDPTVSRLERVRIGSANQVLERKVLLGSYVSGACPAPSNDLDCLPADGESHSIGTVISAPDGTLIVGNGDAAGFTELDPLSLRTYDETSLAGKIMRVDREGRGLANHPFCPGQANLAKTCTKLWAKGFRNPFRFTRRPNGILMVGDVGWTNNEEMDAVWRGGRSFGWPCYEGVIRTPTWRNRPECEPEYAKESTADRHDWPIHAYSHSGFPSSAILAGPEYGGGAYPDEFDGTVFYGDYGQGFIKRMLLDSLGGFAGTVDFAGDWHGIDLTAAPNGDLTWAEPGDWDTGSGSIQRIVYTPNRRPTAVVEANPTTGEAPLAVHFDGSGSSDLDGDALSYDWNFGDGTAHSTQASPVHTYADDGTFTATLTVSDGMAQGTDSVEIDVDNTPPVPAIDAPADGGLYRDGVPLEVRGSATDEQEGTLPASRLEWDVLLRHNDHVHPHTAETGVAEFSLTPLDDHDADSHYEIKLTATDSDGASVSKTITIQPETIPLHLRSQPPGAPMSYAGAELTAPADRETAIGFRTAVGADESFDWDGRTWVFDRWSDGGERAHVITVPDAETTLTALYRDSSGPILGPLPGPPLTPPARRDVWGPRIGFSTTGGVDLRRSLLRGVADDAGGVKAVSIAMARVQRHGCRWLVAKPRRLTRRASSCARPRWIAATVRGRRWSVRLSRVMSRGAYRVRFKATDTLDNGSSRLRDGRASARVRLPSSGR